MGRQGRWHGPLDVPGQAALRAALAEDECEGKGRTGAASCWSKAVGFAFNSPLTAVGSSCLPVPSSPRARRPSRAAWRSVRPGPESADRGRWARASTRSNKAGSPVVASVNRATRRTSVCGSAASHISHCAASTLDNRGTSRASCLRASASGLKSCRASSRSTSLKPRRSNSRRASAGWSPSSAQAPHQVENVDGLQRITKVALRNRVLGGNRQRPRPGPLPTAWIGRWLSHGLDPFRRLRPLDRTRRSITLHRRGRWCGIRHLDVHRSLVRAAAPPQDVIVRRRR